MNVIKSSYEIVDEPDWDNLLLKMERCIRTCYKSEDRITKNSAEKIIKTIINRGHESTLEHDILTVRFIVDRGVSHELVRHRHCSFSQESTRYVNYGKKGMEFILPPWHSNDLLGEWTYDGLGLAFDNKSLSNGDLLWMESMLDAENNYNKLLDMDFKPEQARSLLPNSLKTEIVVTSNIRDWRHIFSLRCDNASHPQMREIMRPLYYELCNKCPVLFDDIEFGGKRD
jgi:thymidylate synthase (FAD)